jgi:hypothetical protein
MAINWNDASEKFQRKIKPQSQQQLPATNQLKNESQNFMKESSFSPRDTKLIYTKNDNNQKQHIGKFGKCMQR